MNAKAARIGAVLLAACLALHTAARAESPASEVGANEVMRWNQLFSTLAAKAETDPLTESRWYAMMHIAVHDALNAIEPRYEPWRPGLAAATGASPDFAIANAAHDVLVAVMPKEKLAFDDALNESMRNHTPNTEAAARDRGVAVGRAAAAAILAARTGDGSERKVDEPAGTKPGAYRPTPPDNTPAFMTQWGMIKPFALKAPAQFRPVPPPAVGSPEAKRDLEEVKRVGVKDGTAKTALQSEIAKYWFENSTQGWNRIAGVIATNRKMDAWDTARLLALTHIAMADGFIGGFEAKYHFDYWRPVTAIREGGDKEWLSDLWTPPVPDYPSTHTVLGAAAAAAIARVIGTDFEAFTMTSGAPYPNLTRSFWSLSEAAHENGCSRILAGIHFTAAVTAGLRQGTQIGHWAADTKLRPVEAKMAGGAGR